MLIMSIDWGKTIGYSLVDMDSGSIVLIGSSDDSDIPLSIFKSLLSKIDTVVFEEIDAPDTEVYQEWLSSLMIVCMVSNIKVDTISPSVWKNSYAKKAKPKLTNHAVDSYRIAYYRLTKLLTVL